MALVEIRRNEGHGEICVDNATIFQIKGQPKGTKIPAAGAP